MAVPADCPLTRRQYQVVCLFATGMTYGQVAHRLEIRPNTVRVHAQAARAHLGVSNSAQAVLALARRGWLPGTTVRAESERVQLDGFEAAYLSAFERHLHGDETARREMSVALMGLREHRGVPHEPPREGPDPLDRILRVVLARW